MPSILPIGTSGVLVRFGDSLSAEANAAAIRFAAQIEADRPEGVEEVAPGLVSVLLRTREGIDFWRLSGELRLRMAGDVAATAARVHEIAVTFDGEDLAEVAGLTGLDVPGFVERHNGGDIRVLATGFAPGFVYCGFHEAALIVPRRQSIRPLVPAGTVLFAAGQTAIAATPIRTGWHVLGRTKFQNFDPNSMPPTRLMPGDCIRFTVAA